MATTFFTLPPELRIEIYTHLLTTLRPATLTIYKPPNRPFWLLHSHSRIFCPPILLVCQATFCEVYPIFIKRVGVPLLRLEHPPAWEVSCVPQPPERFWWMQDFPLRRKAVMRPLQHSLLPILLGVPSLRLEIVVPSGTFEYARDEFGRMLALLDWMRAVLAVRPVNARLNCLFVVVVSTTICSHPEHQTHLPLQHAVEAFEARDVRIERRAPHQRWKEGKLLLGDGTKRRKEEFGRGEWKDVERAWSAMLESCKGMRERKAACIEFLIDIKDRFTGERA